MARRRADSMRNSNPRLRREFKIELESHVAREVGAVIYFCGAVLTYLIIRGRAGMIGEWFRPKLFLLFGIGTWLLPVLFLLLALMLFLSRKIRMDAARYLGIVLLTFSSLGLVHMRTPAESMLDNVEQFGGYVGFLASVLLRIFLSDTGTAVILIALLIISLLITFEISFRRIFDFFVPNRNLTLGTQPEKMKSAKNELNIVKPLLAKSDERQEARDEKNKTAANFQKIAINKPAPIEKGGGASNAKAVPAKEQDYKGWEFPSLELLSSDSSEVFIDDKILKLNAEKIREKLAQFGIDVVMKDVNIGPTVMQYTLKPHEAVKLNRITSLKNDLALALAAKSIRMEAPIPGKPLVGIEVPNDKRMVVRLRELLESEEFKSVHSKLRLPIGRDVSGAPVIDDLHAMPHLLIAGATGSGKSVAMNTFLVALLYQNSPQDLRFIMIDPKRVELTTYNGIPHLLTPVITDTEKALSALKWAVAEMQRRYEELSGKKYRNIEEYNAGEPKKMYKIVVVIDELADLMMRHAKKETEAVVCRIAQMARAVGIHLILATQRPSVDVITGLIKANIPTRIAFTVTSGVDSRTIIDTVGAEDLLGMGDMLYLPAHMSRAIRVQGVYVSSKEIERVTNRIKLTIEPVYNEEIIKSKPEDMFVGAAAAGEGAEQDDLYDQAIEVVRETGKASASLLQRRLSVGYARAARILDIMEEHGAIGPVNGAKAREIYL
ncbi:DNA translocase FtsK 4TM domain-containing protein [Candidatus Peregrinibacteria bacterium]|nr:DNA translocase FtsK 4TM domain-containing protein [Candidatus Peregrinibacteria bacterium]